MPPTSLASYIGGGVSYWTSFMITESSIYIKWGEHSLSPQNKRWLKTCFTQKSAFSTAFQPCMTLVCQHGTFRWYIRLFPKKWPIWAKSTKILAPKTSLPKSPYTETKLIGIRMAYRYEPESVETKMAGGPCMGGPAPNRGWKVLRFGSIISIFLLR